MRGRFRVDALGDYLYEHGGRTYPVQREAIHGGSNLATMPGYQTVLNRIRREQQKLNTGSKRAYVYHNAKAAGITCLNDDEAKE